MISAKCNWREYGALTLFGLSHHIFDQRPQLSDAKSCCYQIYRKHPFLIPCPFAQHGLPYELVSWGLKHYPTSVFRVQLQSLEPEVHCKLVAPGAWGVVQLHDINEGYHVEDKFSCGGLELPQAEAVWPFDHSQFTNRIQ